MDLPEWHLITCEYPPQLGGVSDYTYLVASGLAATGDAVHVWCPSSDGEPPNAPGVIVHTELGGIAPADLRRVGQMLNQFAAPRRLLVQWVPHGYGYQSMNLSFCLWLWRRAAFNHDRIDIMVHEPYLAFGEGSWKQSAAAVVHRIMTSVLLNAACRVWVSIPAWEKSWSPYTLGRRVPFAWLPVPSNIPVVDDPVGVRSLRDRYAPTGSLIVGHFGTYGRHIKELLMSFLPAFLHSDTNHVLLLLGRGGESLRGELVHGNFALTQRIHATGSLGPIDLSKHLSACDVMIQPYPDGVSSRRTSVMSSIAHGLPTITTAGRLTEPVWQTSEAVALAPVGDVAALLHLTHELLRDPTARSHLSTAAKALYQRYFSVSNTVSALRNAGI